MIGRRRLLAMLMAMGVVLAACTGVLTESEELPAATEGGVTCWSGGPATGTSSITFSDVTQSTGLSAPLTGMMGHAAAWGDVNGDGEVDLFVGSFADRPTEEYAVRGADGPSPDRLLLGNGSRFDEEALPEVYGRTSGAAFVDLDGDGDLDLVVSRNPKEPKGGRGPLAAGASIRPSAIYENVDGNLVERPDSGIDPTLGGRSVGVLDYDGDRRYDLFIVEDRWRGGSSRLYRNMGDFQFEDVTEAAGLPLDLQGLSVATADVDGDRDVDLFVSGANVLFIADAGGFRAVDSEVFVWPPIGDEDDPAGAAFGDVDRDGRPDLVIGQHFGSAYDGESPTPVRLFLNRTEEANRPVFIEVTAESGLTGLPTKAPHVEIVDFDNDGWPDILTSASASDGTRPAIFRSLGESGGTVRFETPQGIGASQYWVTAPAADYDRDGRIDIILIEWEPTLPSVLLRNETASGNWLSVSVGPGLGFGLGGRVTAYEAGGLGDPTRVLGSAEITATRGYTAGVEAVAHLGLGDIAVVDLEVVTPWGEPISLTGISANQAIQVPEGC